MGALEATLAGSAPFPITTAMPRSPPMPEGLSASARLMIVAGLAALGGAALAVLGSEALRRTDTQAFCVSCHSMQTVFEEHRRSRHYRNASGVMATCADCHVPEALGPRLVAKAVAAKDVVHEVLGTIDTPEKFEARRWRLANVVWRKMEATDSRECRACHAFSQMDHEKQDRRTARRHQRAEREGRTCIACHKGVAHRLPDPPPEPA